jgi:hypothetical protein
LKRPQPAFIALLASGFSPVYPCHVPPREMRQRPIGTGPFKLVEFKPNESIKLTRNPEYWKPGGPYLDALEYTIIRNVSTAVLTFVSGKFDITFGGLSVPLTNDVKRQAPEAFCELNPTNVSHNLVINRDVAPFLDLHGPSPVFRQRYPKMGGPTVIPRLARVVHRSAIPQGGKGCKTEYWAKFPDPSLRGFPCRHRRVDASASQQELSS